MSLPERLLLGPGPSNAYPEVLAALGQPLLGHLDPEFLRILDETSDRLRTAFRTTNALTLPISGTGSAGMEACFVNLVEPGDTVIVGVNGVFGERMCEVARRCGAEVIRVEAPWGEPVDPQALLDAHAVAPHARLVAVVHAETSTGVRSDIAPLRVLQDTDTLLLVDTVTGLAGIPVEIDGWGVDACYSGTQKCLGVPPGLAPVTFSDRAVERIRSRALAPQSWYLDLGLIGDYVGAARKYHHTAPVSMVVALHAGLGVLLEEGLEASWARHAAAGERLQAELQNLGFTLLAREGHRLPQLTTAGLPAGADEAALRRTMLDRWGIEVGGGLGAFAGTAWRFGLMGHNARERSVTTVLGAIRELQASGEMPTG
jgi:alanine-glyoxylate transaminase/serine-glyoxylate transaminase/serine-pyruvate transaminase